MSEWKIGPPMLRLTDYETGQPVYVRGDAITSIAGLTASQSDSTNTEHGMRTRITLDGDAPMLLVRESAKAIGEAIEKGWEGEA